MSVSILSLYHNTILEIRRIESKGCCYWGGLDNFGSALPKYIPYEFSTSYNKMRCIYILSKISQDRICRRLWWFHRKACDVSQTNYSGLQICCFWRFFICITTIRPNVEVLSNLTEQKLILKQNVQWRMLSSSLCYLCDIAFWIILWTNLLLLG